ncbi:MAG: NUDIX domain-containing protein [Lachnospiraceae bacterium]|nr:NUDIX domain-containing protein [Lachnospiraceae bacterium]
MDGKLRSMTSIYLLSGDQVLLLYRIGSRIVDQLYTGSAGGHFEPDEVSDARACVLREMNEELGLTEADVEHLALRYVTLRLKNGEIRQNYYFFAELKDPSVELKSTEGVLRWFDWDSALSCEMPYTAKYVCEHFRREGRYTDKLYGGSATEAGVVFTVLDEF